MSLHVRRITGRLRRSPPDRGLGCNVVAAAAPTRGSSRNGQETVCWQSSPRYIGIDDKDLEELFTESGVCESAAVITDRATSGSRGFGYVEMASFGGAQKAIRQLDGQEFKGRPVCIYAVNSAGI